MAVVASGGYALISTGVMTSGEQKHEPETSPRPQRLVFAGAEIAGYVVQNLLGAGAMGEVWRVRQKMLNLPRAMKVLKPHIASIDRFEEEMRLLALIEHDNVVKVIDSGKLPDQSLFYVMEFVAGRNLEDDVAKHRGQRPQWEHVRDIILQVCDGLAAIHSRGIIHRDMKPANCMLSLGADKAVHVRIVDLGVAKRLSLDTANTSEGMFIGTPSYASPEQAAGETSRVSYRSDVYSVGVMLYELLTGRIPHTPENGEIRALLYQRIYGQLPPPPSTLVPSGTFPVEVDDIVARALQADPLARFQSMREFADAIRQRVGTTLVDYATPKRASLAEGAPTAPTSSPILPISLNSPAKSQTAVAIPVSDASAGSLSGVGENDGRGSKPSLSAPQATASGAQSTASASPSQRRWVPFLVLAGGLSALALAVVIPRLAENPGNVAAPPSVEPLFQQARAEMRSFGLAGMLQTEKRLRDAIDSPDLPPAQRSQARLLAAELVLMRALACHIAQSINAGNLDSPATQCSTDIDVAAKWFKRVSPSLDPAARARIKALQLIHAGAGKSVITEILPKEAEELVAIAMAAPFWHDVSAVPTASQVDTLQSVEDSTTLLRSIIAMLLLRMGRLEQAQSEVDKILEVVPDQPVAVALRGALARASAARRPAADPSSSTNPRPVTLPGPPPPSAAPTSQLRHLDRVQRDRARCRCRSCHTISRRRGWCRPDQGSAPRPMYGTWLREPRRPPRGDGALQRCPEKSAPACGRPGRGGTRRCEAQRRAGCNWILRETVGDRAEEYRGNCVLSEA
jgi:serine/threonine protein kinase